MFDEVLEDTYTTSKLVDLFVAIDTKLNEDKYHPLDNTLSDYINRISMAATRATHHFMVNQDKPVPTIPGNRMLDRKVALDLFEGYLKVANAFSRSVTNINQNMCQYIAAEIDMLHISFHQGAYVDATDNFAAMMQSVVDENFVLHYHNLTKFGLSGAGWNTVTKVLDLANKVNTLCHTVLQIQQQYFTLCSLDKSKFITDEYFPIKFADSLAMLHRLNVITLRPTLRFMKGAACALVSVVEP